MGVIIVGAHYDLDDLQVCEWGQAPSYVLSVHVGDGFVKRVAPYRFSVALVESPDFMVICIAHGLTLEQREYHI